MLPNIRKLFLPDRGHLICEVDLSGADAQVVAWEARDEDLKAAFRAGLKVHIKNARDVFPDATATLSDAEIKEQDAPGGLYYNCKRAVHATNYGGKPPTLAAVLKWRVAEAQSFQNTWFGLHPGIREWQNRTEHNLAVDRTVSNAFGYRRVYYDRTSGLLGQALAWIPQSTVALCTFKAALRIKTYLPWVQLLLQVHDSLVFQIPTHRESSLPLLKPVIEVPVPYPDPLVIPWTLKTSPISWGHAEHRSW